MYKYSNQQQYKCFMLIALESLFYFSLNNGYIIQLTKQKVLPQPHTHFNLIFFMGFDFVYG